MALFAFNFERFGKSTLPIKIDNRIMANRVRDLAGRFWSHCTGPVTVRSLVFFAVMGFFLWALFDRLATKDHNRAMQQRLDLYSIEVQKGLAQIYESWSKFDAAQGQVLRNQRAMQDEINTQTAILNTERKIRESEKRLREKELARPKTHQSSRGLRPRRRSSVRVPRLQSCYRIEDRVNAFGNGAEVKQQILVPMPCP